MMKRSVSSFYGKAFLWLLAIATAALVEGFLLSSTDVHETFGTIAGLTDLQATMPEAAVQVDRVVEFISFIVGVFKLTF